MPPSQIAAYARYYQPGITRVYIVQTMANYLAPTRAELDAGTDVTRQVRAIDGWAVDGALLDTPDMSNEYTSRIAGRTESPDSSLTFYGAQSGSDIRTLQPRLWAGFVVMLDGGDTAGFKMDVYPVLVRSAPKQRGDSDAFGIVVQYAITSKPAENVAIPA